MPTFDHNGHAHQLRRVRLRAIPSLLAMPGWGGTIDELMPVAPGARDELPASSPPTCPAPASPAPSPAPTRPGYYQDDARTILRAMLECPRRLTRAPRRLQRRRRVRARHGRHQARCRCSSVVTWGAAGSARRQAPDDGRRHRPTSIDDADRRRCSDFSELPESRRTAKRTHAS